MRVDELGSFVSVTAPRAVPVPAPPTARVRFLGHACVLVEESSSRVLVDPLVAHRRPGATDRFSFADLSGRIDCVSITHAHLDHLDIETLLQIRHLVDTVVVPRVGAGDVLDSSLKLVLRAIGFTDVRELDDFESHPVGSGAVTALPFFGEQADLTVRGKAGYAVALGGATCALLADSQCLEPRVYDLARAQVGPVAALFVGMECEGSPMATANGPYLPEGVHTTEMSESRRTKASDAESASAPQRRLRRTAAGGSPGSRAARRSQRARTTLTSGPSRTPRSTGTSRHRAQPARRTRSTRRRPRRHPRRSGRPCSVGARRAAASRDVIVASAERQVAGFDDRRP